MCTHRLAACRAKTLSLDFLRSPAEVIGDEQGRVKVRWAVQQGLLVTCGQHATRSAFVEARCLRSGCALDNPKQLRMPATQSRSFAGLGLQALKLEKTRLEAVEGGGEQKAVGTGEYETIEADLVGAPFDLPAPVPDSGLPFWEPVSPYGRACICF